MQRYKDGAKMRLEGAEKLVVQVRGDKSQKWGNKDEGVSLELKTDEAVSWELRVHLVVVEEEEVSVESLLQSTPENTLEDLEVETKSETRKLIEKFVDENPEAVASLLRNWLNEDWGM